MLRLIIVVAVVLSVPAATHAQSSSDALGKCLADNTSGKDRKDLATWVFVAMAAHPDIKQYATANSALADQNAQTIAALITRLLTQACVTETRAVVRGGASSGFQLAFDNLGRLAMLELMADKSVTESLGLVERYLDQKHVTEVVQGK